MKILWTALWWLLLYPIFSWGVYLLWPPSWDEVRKDTGISPWLFVPFFPLFYYSFMLYVAFLCLAHWSRGE